MKKIAIPLFLFLGMIPTITKKKQGEMMSYIKRQFLAIIIIVGGLVLANSNSFPDYAENALVIDRFPTQVGNSWEYRRTFYVVVYDTVHGDTTEYFIEDSLHEEFEAIDTLAGWECYRLKRVLFEQGDTFPETWWYAHPDSALLWIAYLYGYESKNTAKPRMNVKLWFQEKSFENPRQLAQHLYQAKNSRDSYSKADTNYWSPPKKLFIFPLDVGASWVAMTDPWLEQREVTAEDSVTVPAGTFFALATKITSAWMEEPDLWYNWVAEEGIIKDTLFIRGIATDTLGNAIGYWDSEDTYELLGYQTGSEENPQNRPITVGLKIIPNPFTTVTRIELFAVRKNAKFNLSIYDVSGRRVRDFILYPSFFILGVTWDGRDEVGNSVTPGIYFLKLNGKPVGKVVKVR